MDVLDRQLLDQIQVDFPLSERPYRLLAERLSSTEDEIINRLRKLKDEDRVIRTISAIFDGKKLGYASALIAVKVPLDKISSVVQRINSSPLVSHNYSRNHEYNIWFTLSIPEEKDIETLVRNFVEEFELSSYLVLPSLKTYKLKVKFDMESTQEVFEKPFCSVRNCASCFGIDDTDRSVIKQLQADLPFTKTPFNDLANQINIQPAFFISLANEYLSGCLMRRYCASLRHRVIGYNSNAMVVWSVDEEDIDKLGHDVKRFKFVSHCYQRKLYPQWPYNFYTMVHAKTEDDLEINIQKISKLAKIDKYEVLHTVEEFKKDRVRYFENRFI